MNSLPHHTIMFIEGKENRISSRFDPGKDFVSLICAGKTDDCSLLFAQNPIELVVLSIEVAVINGFEIIAALRKINPAISVILLSSHVNMQTIKLAALMGCSDVLQTPADENQIKAIITNHIQLNPYNENFTFSN